MTLNFVGASYKCKSHLEQGVMHFIVSRLSADVGMRNTGKLFSVCVRACVCVVRRASVSSVCVSVSVCHCVCVCVCAGVMCLLL